MIDNIVTKSNSLIEAKYKDKLTLEEQRIILFLVSQIQPNDEDFKTYSITISEFTKILDLKTKSKHQSLVSISRGLRNKEIVIQREGSTLITGWISSVEYFNKNGTIELSFDPKLKPYLLKLKDNFTSYKLKDIIKIKSANSMRIYELLKQYERIKERVISLDELRDYLCISDEKYPLYANFKQRVLVTAQKELKEKSDIYFEFEPIKKGKKVDMIKFKILNNKSKNENKIEDKQETLIKQLKKIIKEPLAENELSAILNSADNDIDKIKSRYLLAKNKKGIDNLVGFLIWACKTSEDNIKTSKSDYSNKQKYDFDELERLELLHLENSLKKKT